jgi:hypothetical protein
MVTAIFVMVIAILVLQLVGSIVGGVTAYRSDQRMKRDQEEHERRMADLARLGPPPLRPVPKDATLEPTTVQVGHKDGQVVLNFFGTSEVAASHVVWSPTDAREVARQLLASADAVEPICSPSPEGSLRKRIECQIRFHRREGARDTRIVAVLEEILGVRTDGALR